MKSDVPESNSFFDEYSIFGWVAFGCSVLFSFILIVWYYRNEAERAKKALQTERYHNSERATLINDKRRSSMFSKYKHLSSDEDETCDEWNDDRAVPVSDVNNSLMKLLNASINDRRYPIFISSVSQESASSGMDIPAQMRSFKQNLDISTMSTGSDSTQVSVRPLSYREMRKNAFRSPAMITVSYAV